MLELYQHQQQALNETAEKNRVAIPGYEGIYEIDRDGNVFCILSDKYHKPRQIKPFENGSGYLRVQLHSATHQCKKHYVHRLVAMAFIPNPYNKKIVNHIDCNTHNNNVNNLEWVTQSENILHAIKLGRYVDNISKYNNRKKVI